MTKRWPSLPSVRYPCSRRSSTYGLCRRWRYVHDYPEDLACPVRIPQYHATLCRCMRPALSCRNPASADSRMQNTSSIRSISTGTARLIPTTAAVLPLSRQQSDRNTLRIPPRAGFVTTYLTPFSLFLSQTTQHLGTTIVAHPGGILDEILYNTRGLDTVVEPTILFIAFAIASYLYRKG